MDTHLHGWRWADLRTRWPAPQPLDRDHLPRATARLAALAGVESAMLVEAGSSLEELVALATEPGAERFVTGIVATLDLTSPSVREAIEVLRATPLVRGARMNLEALGDATVLRRRPVLEALRAVAEAGLVWEFLVTAEQLSDALAALAAVPDLRAVVEHLGKPLLTDPVAKAAWKHDMHRVAADTRAMCKLSFGFRADSLELVARERSGWPIEALREPVAHLLGEFGPDRLVWGSDWPLSALLGRYSDSVEAFDRLVEGCQPAEMERIFRTNAEGLYRTGSHGLAEGEA